MVQNKRLRFNAVGSRKLVPGQDVYIDVTEVDLDGVLPPNGILLKNLYASFDPYLRRHMFPAGTVNPMGPMFDDSKPLENACISKVLASANGKFKENEYVMGKLPMEQYTILGTSEEDQASLSGLQKLENPHGIDDLKVFLGTLGMPGLTAYSSLHEIGKPKKGESIFISAASGAVGQVVGQLAQREGLKVIGSVGSDDKLDYILNDLKFDAGFNYKKENPKDALARLAPNGIDIYYDNVGGVHLEAAIEALNHFGRIVACGQVSEYERSESEKYGIKNTYDVVGKRLTWQGFIVFDENMGPKYLKELQDRVGAWIKDGSFTTLMHVSDGIDQGPEGFVAMLDGRNFGKAVLKIQDEVNGASC